MVFYSFVLVMKPRPRQYTAQALREIAVAAYTKNALIRSLKNEGIMRPYSRFRDADHTAQTYARYVTIQLDMAEDAVGKWEKTVREHADVYKMLKLNNLENPLGTQYTHNDTDAAKTPLFPLDTFVRLEEEINWPPQVSGDVYEQLDMNWKEFSRTRWSNFLRN